MIALFPSQAPAPGVRSVLDRLADQPRLALGMVSASQGPYDPAQPLIDVGQGARVETQLYRPRSVPRLLLSGAALSGWGELTRRAASAPAGVRPGLLAASVPGGAALVAITGPAGQGASGRRHPGAVLAADLAGRLAAVSVGPGATVAIRARRVHRLLTVVELPAGRGGERQLEALLARRLPDELLLALESPPEGSGAPTLWLGAAGLRPAAGGMLGSATTRVPGLVSATDIAPTVLRHLRLAVPRAMTGQVIGARGRTDKAALERLQSRLTATDERKLPALRVFLLAWGVLILVCGLLGPEGTGLRAGLRAGGPAALWLPSLSLLTAALEPSRSVELAVVAGGALGLGLLTDRLVAWPRAPAVPALVGLAAYAVDLARGSPLLDRSLLGPGPLAGVRFYGVDNDLEIAITLLLLAAFAATARGRGRDRRSAATLAAAGAGLALIVCPARLGADVGGLFTIAAGVGVGALALLPRRSTRLALVVALSPLLGLVALAGVDLATGGNGHFVRTILHAGSAGDLVDLLRRRYDVAWDTLSSGFQIPLYTALAVLLAAYAHRFRARLYAGVDDPWRAFLAGGLAAAVACAMFNDSGPLPLIEGVGVLGLLTAYLRCPAPEPRVPAPPPASRRAGALQAAGR